MAKTDFKCVDDYLASQPEAAKAALARVREAIRKALPGAEEVISYQIPACKMQGRAAIYFSGWKRHYSLYRPRKRWSRHSGKNSRRTRWRRERCAFRCRSPSRKR